MISVLVVDDDPLVRLGLQDILGGDPDIDVVGEAGTGGEAVEFVTRRAVDVALIDIRMPGMDGIAAIAEMRAVTPTTGTIAMTTFDVDEYVYGALRAGADGFLLKDAEPADFVRAVHLVAGGSAMLHPAAARRVLDRYHSDAAAPDIVVQRRIDRLTPRERDVLQFLASGESNAEIADRLGMRESTVKAHVSRILSALSVSNRVQAALAWRDSGGHR